MSQVYQLPVGSKDNERLKFQSDTLKQVSYPHLEQAGLNAEMIVADIGCGNGMMILHFLDIGVKEIYAIDASKEQLDETAKNVNFWLECNPDKTANVVYVQIDITKDIDPNLKDKIDLAFIRFVMNNIRIQDHHNALNNIKSLLKPGGKCVCEESVWDNIFCSSCPEEVEEYKKYLYDDAFKGGDGIDRNVGKYLPKLFTESNYDIDYYQILNRHVTPLELKTMYNSIIKIVKNKLVIDENKSEEEKKKIFAMFDKWDIAFNTIPENDNNVKVQTSGTGCITASKPMI